MTPAEFVPTFPCFAVFAEDCSGPFVVPTECGQALIVLTDDDLQTRYRKKNGLVGPTIRFDDAKQLTLYLDALPPTIMGVAFDPTDVGNAHFVSAKDLLNRLLGWLHNQD